MSEYAVRKVAGYVPISVELTADASGFLDSMHSLISRELSIGFRRMSLKLEFPEWWARDVLLCAEANRLREEQRRLELGWWGRFYEDHLAWTPTDEDYA